MSSFTFLFFNVFNCLFFKPGDLEDIAAIAVSIREACPLARITVCGMSTGVLCVCVCVREHVVVCVCVCV